MALHHLATQPGWPYLSCHPISSNTTSWYCNQSMQFIYDVVLRHHIIVQAFIGNVSCVCLCRCTNMYIIHHIVTTINPHQAHINISTRQFNIYIIHHIITRQWPFSTASESLTTANFMPAVATNLNIEESTIWAYSLQRGPISLQRVLPVLIGQSTNSNPSLLVAVRANLAATSTHNFDQLSHIITCAYQQNQFITTQSFVSL